MAYLDASSYVAAETAKVPLYIVGLGGQGLAWCSALMRGEQKNFTPAFCLRAQSPRREKLKAILKGKAPLLTPDEMVQSIQALAERHFDAIDETQVPQPALHVLICLLISDDAIGEFYRTYLAGLKDVHLTLVVAHGYCVYSGDLKPESMLKNHEVALFAPKVIGPILSAAKFDAYSAHGFRAAVNLTELSTPAQKAVRLLATELGFAKQSLIEVSPEIEAMGDLISEQGLLCGGFLHLLKSTAQAMKSAGVPDDLMAEECLRELGYIVNLIEKEGLTGMMHAISDAAKAGTVFASHEFELHPAGQAIKNLTQNIQQKKFVKDFQSTNWKNSYEKIAKHLHEFFPAKKTQTLEALLASESPMPVRVSSTWVKKFKMREQELVYPSVKASPTSRRISMLTAYDYPTATLVDEAGVDLILVGDSVAPVVHGEPDTLAATMEMMILHTKAVAKAAKRALVIADMPFMSYQASLSEALTNAGRLMREGRAQAVKLEGGKEIAHTVEALVQAGIPVVAHIGLTPQSINTLGGYRTHGKNEAEAEALKESALALQNAGAFCIVLECVTAGLAQEITAVLSIPTIGIGSGIGVCDGEVLVFHDVVGLTVGRRPSFVRPTLEARSILMESLRKFVDRTNREGTRSPDLNHSHLLPHSDHSPWLTT